MFTPYENAINSLNSQKNQWISDFKQPKQTLQCKYCGTTLDDFLTTGFVGCANCYQAFRDYLPEFALDIHGRNMHVGKLPKIEASKAAKRREIEKLKELEESAALSKNYIMAEQYKNQIIALEGEIR